MAMVSLELSLPPDFILNKISRFVYLVYRIRKYLQGDSRLLIYCFALHEYALVSTLYVKRWASTHNSSGWSFPYFAITLPYWPKLEPAGRQNPDLLP